MRKVIYFAMVSLDGFIARPDGDLDWASIDEELHKYVNDQQGEYGAYLYGRRMYEIMAGSWPTVDADPSAPEYMVEFAGIWKRMPKIVFSKTLEHVEWNARLVRGDVGEEVTRLKEQPGKDLVLGGAGIAATLMQRGLVDEYRIFVHPVVLGSGRRLFPAFAGTIKLRLAGTRPFGSGVVYLCYRRTDDAEHG